MNGLNSFTSAPINMKYHCTKCKTEITEIRHPIVVCQYCLEVQLVPFRYRPKYETREVPDERA